MSLIDLHGMTLDRAIDNCLDMIKESLKIQCRSILETRKYPVIYKLNNDQVILVNKDGTTIVEDNKEGKWFTNNKMIGDSNE